MQAYIPPQIQSQQKILTYTQSPQDQSVTKHMNQSTGTTLSNWVNNSATEIVAGTRSNPLHINQIIQYANRLGFTSSKATKTNVGGATSRSIRFFAHDQDPLTVANNSNSTSSKYYYLDMMCDIGAARNASKSLKDRGYYDLNGIASDVLPEIANVLSDRIRAAIPEKGEIRTPVYLSGDVSSASVRIFEHQSVNANSLSLEVYVAESGTLGKSEPTLTAVTLDNLMYLKYSGKVRVTGTFSGVMIANNYIKLLFTARTIIINGQGSRSVGGIKVGDSQNQEIDELMLHIRSIVDSGIPVSMIRSVLDDALSNRIKAVSSDVSFKNLVSDKSATTPQLPYTAQGQTIQSQSQGSLYLPTTQPQAQPQVQQQYQSPEYQQYQPLAQTQQSQQRSQIHNPHVSQTVHQLQTSQQQHNVPSYQASQQFAYSPGQIQYQPPQNQGMSAANQAYHIQQQENVGQPLTQQQQYQVQYPQQYQQSYPPLNLGNAMPQYKM